VISGIKRGYEAYKRQGGATGADVVDEVIRKKDRLRSVNDEIMHLRNQRMSSGSLNDRARRRWEDLRAERDQLLSELNQKKEVRAAEKILETENVIDKVEIDLETTHVLQYNAFADTLGKQCRICSRPMKLQWKRDLSVAEPKDFYWGCTGWYVVQGDRRACTHTESLQKNDYGLMTDTTAPEFSMTAEEFGIILTDKETEKIIDTRLKDLKSDLNSGHRGVELATCPVHGENMVLRKKQNATGLLDSYFLACPYWLPNNAGCTFIEKLKSGSQLAALLKSETGRGVL
jgi:flagellar hook-associated protein FlgK